VVVYTLEASGVSRDDRLGGEEFGLGIHAQVALGMTLLVAGDAVHLEDRFHFLDEVDLLASGRV
jgi:hypothetical protein